MGITLHQDVMEQNHRLWARKPLLHKVYVELYKVMAAHRSNLPAGKMVELGSGMGSIHETLPECLRTDLFPYPWIDQVENAYCLTFESDSISDLLMVDVFHHLRYPGTALKELNRVLKQGGRLIMMEPSLSLLGYLIYGPLHKEPIGLTQPIQWLAPHDWSPHDLDYYAAQGNATRIFLLQQYKEWLEDWNIVEVKPIPALAYAASGGYSGPQLYPAFIYPLIKFAEKVMQPFPKLFATRLLVVLEKVKPD